MIVAAVLALLGALLPLLSFLRHRGAGPLLSAANDPEPRLAGAWPRLSVVVPARDEEATVAEAAASLLAQDYPALEVVLVDDRSSDRTGELMARAAAAHPGRAVALRVEALPPGWLGKPHALWLGSQRATGEWLLFADADVVFAPGCLRRAVAYAEAAGLDHLTLWPRVTARGYWLRAFVAVFGYLLLVYGRAYLANDPRSPVGIGLGAFNLLRRRAYDAVGTHAALALRPDDDVRLGRRIKALGLRQRLLNGSDLLWLEWYPSLGAAVRGFDKNLFAGFDYRPAAALGGAAAVVTVLVWPFAAVWRAAGAARWLLGATVAADAAGFLAAGAYTEGRLTWRRVALVPALPAGALLFAYTILRSAALVLSRGGIRWRGTFYPLAELRSQTGLPEAVRG
jgi:hypothetical protein